MTSDDQPIVSEFSVKDRLPGIIAIALLLVTTSLWMFWGTMEMFYEGWGLPFPQPLAYLIPAAICLLLSAVAVTWPLIGGGIIMVIGGAFTVWWIGNNISAYGFDLGRLLTLFPVSGMLIIIGVLFLFEDRFRKQRASAGWTPPPQWYRRHFRYLVAIGIPLAIMIGISIGYAPIVLSRVDDGDRGARIIDGNGVTLVWAPAGPGWNWKQDFGGYPSWNSLARYGVEPIGLQKEGPRDTTNATQAEMDSTCLCCYLTEDGLTLMDEPQHIWRMPTTDEIVRSLVIHNENAGCTWDSGSVQAQCDKTPDKETPLWAPDQEPIYYWTADQASYRNAYYVSYNGWVHHQPKSWGNPRHGYRCVKEVDSDPAAVSDLPNQSD